MDAQKTAVAVNCLEAAYAGSLAFPAIVGKLIEAGFESYSVDYRRHTATYFLPSGDSLTLETPACAEAVAPEFDRPGIAAQIKWAQVNPPDYSYAAFCRNVKAFGCAGYIVSFLGRRVLYFGRAADIHVEHFPL